MAVTNKSASFKNMKLRYGEKEIRNPLLMTQPRTGVRTRPSLA